MSSRDLWILFTQKSLTDGFDVSITATMPKVLVYTHNGSETQWRIIRIYPFAILATLFFCTHVHAVAYTRPSYSYNTPLPTSIPNDYFFGR